jgi:Ser/Thr protein kinase RdoA (MazF antagonist)
MEEILEKWHIGPVATSEPTPFGGGKTSFVTTVDGDCFVLKARPDPVHAQREYALALELSKAGVPVPVPITTVDGDLCVAGRGEKIFWLYPKLPGRVITEHYVGDAEERARAFGRAIGFLHMNSFSSPSGWTLAMRMPRRVVSGCYIGCRLTKKPWLYKWKIHEMTVGNH